MRLTLDPGAAEAPGPTGHIRRQGREVPVPSAGVAALQVSAWFRQGSISRDAT